MSPCEKVFRRRPESTAEKGAWGSQRNGRLIGRSASLAQAAAGNLPEQNKNNKYVNRPPEWWSKNMLILLICRVQKSKEPGGVLASHYLASKILEAEI